MTTETFMPMKWSEVSDRPNDNEYCACCNKWVAPKSRRAVETTADMSEAVRPGVEIDPADSGGFFTVGPDCAKKYLPGFTTKA